MMKTTYRIALMLSLGVAALGCSKSDKETQPAAKNVAESTPDTPGLAAQETKPLEFRIDGMRRVNGAL